MAYDDGYYYGQCKIVAVVDNAADNGKTVLITTDDNKTYSGTIANKKCEFLLPPRTLYTVQKVSDGAVEFTTEVEAGYGDCILVHLNTGYVVVKQGDIVGLDYIKTATADALKNKVPEANAVKTLNSSLLEKKTTTISSYSKNTNIILPDSLNNHRYINLYFKIKTYASINSVTIDTYALKNLGSIVSIYYMTQADGISAFTITYIDENTISANSDLTDVLIVMN